MNIGNFEDFMNTLTPEVIAAITEDANMKAREMREGANPSDKDYRWNQIAAICLTYSLELLALYHKWLEQQP